MPARPVVPLFPLPGVWLFPYLLLPLHVFEARYRQMIEDSLDGPGRIVLGTVLEGHEEDLAEAPPVHPIAGLGEIGRHESLDDGRFLIWLMGLKRVRIQEVQSDRLYRKVEIEPAEEVPVPEKNEQALRTELTRAVRSRTGKKEIPDRMPASHLADLLVLSLPLPSAVRSRLYGELDAEKRALTALAEHARRT